MSAVASTDGGASFAPPVMVSTVSAHTVKDMRTAAFPTVDVDGGGRIFAVWQDCRFRPQCPNDPNDLVITHSDDGVNWTRVVRIPVDAGVRSRAPIDHFIPGLAVDPSTRLST